MKNSTIAPTASLGLQILRWVAFSQAATSGYVNLTASVDLTQVSVINELNRPTRLRFIAASAMPAWVKVGTAVKISAAVTLSGTSYDVSVSAVVREIDDATGLYFEVDAPRAGGISDDGTARNLDVLFAGGKASLIMQCQKAMLKASSGSVIIAPCADATGANAPYEVTLDSSTGEYEITSQQGTKFDLADYLVKTGSAGTLAVRFQ